jgi:hypothetical protein
LNLASDGMTAAHRREDMKKAGTSSKSAERTGYKLPVGRISAPAEGALEPASGLFSARNASLTAPPRNEIETRPEFFVPLGIRGEEAEAIFTNDPDLDLDPTTERIERIEALLSREAQLVRRSGAESLAVVLRPDRDTELWVQFNQRAGQLIAEVRCDRGDFAGLTTHWDQLREALATHEVRLLPLHATPGLSTETAPAGGPRTALSEDRTSHRHHPPSEPPAEPRTRAAFAADPAGPSESTARRTVRRDRWESWA